MHADEQFEPLNEAGMPARESGDTSQVVIIGAGIAGISAAESARAASPKCRITLICGESPLPYYRLNLTRYLAGEITLDALLIHDESWYRNHGIDLLLGTRVKTISTADHAVTLADGAVIEYHKLILAMGAHPFIPPMAGTDLGGVVSLRTTADADSILQRAESKPACVCIGGGVLGLEIAGALTARGLDVTVLESHEWLMPRQLNRRAGELLEIHLAGLGIGLEKQAQTRAILGKKSASGVELGDGRIVPAELIVVATGVHPDTDLALKAGIKVNRGVVVDNHLRTSAADVFAAGDVAEHDGVLYGIWGPSKRQGNIAGLNAVGVDTLFDGMPRSNILKVLGLALLSIGRFEPENGSDQVVDHEEDDKFYHFVFKDGKLVGCIIIGDTALAAAVKKAIEDGRDCSAILSTTPFAPDICRFLAG